MLKHIAAVRIFVRDLDRARVFCSDPPELRERRLPPSCRARGAFDAPPETQHWGGTLAFPRDPDGNTLTLVG
jgi:hypothetical protein